jgi:putative endonuclease
MAFTVYILYSPSTNKFYVGQTKDLQRRFYEHNNGQSKSTKHGSPWQIVFTEDFQSRSEAVRREGKIKAMKSKHYIQNLVQKLQDGS